MMHGLSQLQVLLYMYVAVIKKIQCDFYFMRLDEHDEEKATLKFNFQWQLHTIIVFAANIEF